MARFRLSYNAPVTLSFTILAVVVFGITAIVGQWFTSVFFTLGTGMSFLNPAHLLTFITYPLGHSSWDHLSGNMLFVLLLGPLLEEKYGRSDMLMMFGITTIGIAIVNTVFFSTGLLGASGIVFMLIVLSSFTNLREGTLPITAVVVAALFVGREALQGFNDDNISQMAHIVGGVFGLGFGLLASTRKSA